MGEHGETVKKMRNYLSRTEPIKSGSEIPGFCKFSKIYLESLRLAKDGDNFVEIGSFLGHSTALMASLVKISDIKINFYSIDPWRADCYDDEQIRNTLSEFSINGSYKHHVEKSLNDLRVRDYVNLVQDTSENAVEQLKHLSFKFIFIDGLHDYENVNRDIKLWKPLLASGGMIGGDDYFAPGVIKATDENFKKITISEGNWPYWFFKNE